MKNYGFVKVASGIIPVQVANPAANAAEMEKMIFQAAKQNVRVLSFAELSLTGYTCGDLFLQPLLLQKTQQALATLLKNTAKQDIIFIIGLPVAVGSELLDAAAVCYRGKILGVVPKTYLSNFRGCGEARWFTPALHWEGTEIALAGQTVAAGTDLLFQAGGFTFGIELGSDLNATLPPSAEAVAHGAEVIFNLSASNALVKKHEYLHRRILEQSARCLCGYVYTSCGFGESSTDVVFDGSAWICENGEQLASSVRFETEAQLICAEIDVERLHHERKLKGCAPDHTCAGGACYQTIPSGQAVKPVTKLERKISPMPFVPQGAELAARCEEIFNIQVLGLATRLHNAHIKTVTVGISGGLDSTLTLLVCAKTFDKLGLSRKQITGVTMPGFGTTDRTYKNALSLMKALGITVREISIKAACEQHFKDIGHKLTQHDVTYENAQARERTQILMDISNQTGGIVVGTGDLSELALGWATYNGDHMSMYGVNAGVPKTLMRAMVDWISQTQVSPAVRRTLQDVLATPISPELLPAKNGKIAQKTEDLVGPYELHDFFLYHFLRRGCTPEKIFFLAQQAFGGKFSAPVIKKWLKVFFRRFFTQQFKRSCMPDGPKVGSVGLSARGDFKMPSDVSAAAWLEEVEIL